MVGGSRKVEGKGGGYSVTDETHFFKLRFRFHQFNFAKLLQKTPLTKKL